MITRDKGLPLDINALTESVTQHDLSKDRLAKLLAYFAGNHTILSRLRTTGMPNNRLVHGFPQYIAVTTSSYLVGDPVQYMDDKQEKALEAVMAAYESADVQSVDAEVALHQAIFGKGTELCYANAKAEPRVTAINPQDAFVVYDDTAEALPLFGVYRLNAVKPDGTGYTKSITMYTATEIIQYSATADGKPGQEESRIPHNFGIVPLIEYWNNSVETGDFENVMTLIDAYDTLESDRVNDKEQFSNAILVLMGVIGFDAAKAGDLRTPMQRVKENGVLTLPADAAAAYLTKTMDETDTDVLRKAIQQDIHKFSQVPDLSDEKFAGNSSGVAMKYKLFGLEQVTKTKERWFREGLRWRLRIISNFLALKGSPKLDADKVQIVFKRSLPVNDAEIATMIATLKDIVPDDILLAQVPFIEDVDAAIDALAKQKQENIKAQAAAFGSFPNANDDTQEDKKNAKGAGTKLPEDND